MGEARELGSYQLTETLGKGGMGEVWRARHRMLARDAAIKFVQPELLAGGVRPQSGSGAAPIRTGGADHGVPAVARTRLNSTASALRKTACFIT